MVWSFQKIVAWRKARAERKAARYIALYATLAQTDDEFVAACRAQGVAHSRDLILGIRRIMAGYGMVPPEYIPSTATYFDDLCALPHWDSLDSVELVLQIEEVFEVTIPDREAEKMLNPEIAPIGTVVADFIQDWGGLIERLRSSGAT